VLAFDTPAITDVDMMMWLNVTPRGIGNNEMLTLGGPGGNEIKLVQYDNPDSVYANFTVNGAAPYSAAVAPHVTNQFATIVIRRLAGQWSLGKKVGGVLTFGAPITGAVPVGLNKVNVGDVTGNYTPGPFTGFFMKNGTFDTDAKVLAVVNETMPRFNPGSLSPAMWFDFDDMTTLFQDSAGTIPVTAAGQPVGRVNDKSGRGRHMLQATAAARPIYTLDGGVGSLQFDGVDDAMSNADGAFLPATADVFVALNNNNADNIWTTLQYASSFMGVAQSGNTGESPSGGVGGAVDFVNGVAVVPGSRGQFHTDMGSAIGKVWEVQGANLGSWSNLLLNSPGSTFAFTGRMHSVFVSATLTDANRQKMRTYMATRAGITIPAFNPLSVSPTAWYDPSDTATLFQSGTRAAPGTAVTASGQPVGLVLDKSGNNYDLEQPTSSARPLFSVSSGVSSFHTDGVDDFLDSLAFASFTQPNSIALSFILGTNSNSSNIFDGGAARQALVLNPNKSLSLFAGSGVTPDATGPLVEGTPYVVNIYFDAGASFIRVNGIAQPVVGSSPGASGLDKIRLGTFLSGAGQANVKYGGVILRDAPFTAAESAKIETYLGGKVGLVL